VKGGLLAGARLGAVVAILVPAAAIAQVPLPLGDAAVRVEGDVVVAVALGPVPDDTTLAPGRLSARALGRQRALAMLHAWLDAAVRSAALSPRRVRDLHDAIDARADLRRVRSRSDGSAVVELTVPVSALRDVACAGGLPWCP
jgi:hypothetical protein